MTDRLSPPTIGDARGSPMGRTGQFPENGTIVSQKVHLNKVHINAGGYDRGGAYWGAGREPLWWVYSPDGELDYYLRAWSRPAAKAKLLKMYPGIRFLR